MNYRSGRNPHEPTKEDHHSRIWQFIIRHDYPSDAPLAFLPHVNQVSWIFTPIPRNQRYGLLRGIVRFSSTRTYYIMKTRYSKHAEWIPLALHAHNKIAEYTTRPLLPGLIRYSYHNPNPVSLQRVGYGISVPDLLEDWYTARLMEEYEEEVANYVELPPKKYPEPFVPKYDPWVQEDVEYWVDDPETGDRYFLARWVNGELLQTLPD